ncbi:MAG: ribonuclease P protein component [Bacteroidetes bacterium]|nr:ribonuclease P protein component [Bacteroidota bacterium]
MIQKTALSGNRFSKNERLSSRKLITELFETGKSIHLHPIRLTWQMTVVDSGSPVQAAFSVPAKTFRSAVDRNRIKRQMKEVYRKNKSSVYRLLEQHRKQCVLMIVYTGKAMPAFEEIEHKLKLTLLRLEDDFKKNIQ